LHEIGYLRPASPQQFLSVAMNAEKLASPRQPQWDPSRAFIDVGYACLRDGFSTSSAFMAFKCGPPEVEVGHNHYDHNSFQINFNGTWIATDPGYVGYFNPPENKYGRSTFGHNSILLDLNEGYLADMRVPIIGHDQACKNRAKIVDYYSSASFDYLKGSAAEAYTAPAAGADACLHFWREGEGMGFAKIDGPRPIGSEWKQYEFSGVAPDGAATFCLALQFSGSGSVWYDDAELFVDGKKLDLPNPGFEVGTDEDFKLGKGDWKSRAFAPDAGKHELDSTVAHSGKRSARIDGPGGYYYWLPQGRRIPIKPGQKITARFWARCGGLKVMERADREVLFIKPYTFVIRDTLAAPEAHSFSFMLHTRGVIAVTGQNSAVLTAPGLAWRLTSSPPRESR